MRGRRTRRCARHGDVRGKRLPAVRRRGEKQLPAAARLVAAPVVPGDAHHAVPVDLHDGDHAVVQGGAGRGRVVVVQAHRIRPAASPIGGAAADLVPDDVDVVAVRPSRAVPRHDRQRECAGHLGLRVGPRVVAHPEGDLGLGEGLAAVLRPHGEEGHFGVLFVGQREKVLVEGDEKRAVGEDDGLGGDELAAGDRGEQLRLAHGVAAVVERVQEELEVVPDERIAHVVPHDVQAAAVGAGAPVRGNAGVVGRHGAAQTCRARPGRALVVGGPHHDGAVAAHGLVGQQAPHRVGADVAVQDPHPAVGAGHHHGVKGAGLVAGQGDRLPRDAAVTAQEGRVAARGQGQRHGRIGKALAARLGHRDQEIGVVRAGRDPGLVELAGPDPQVGADDDFGLLGLGGSGGADYSCGRACRPGEEQRKDCRNATKDCWHRSHCGPTPCYCMFAGGGAFPLTMGARTIRNKIDDRDWRE